MTVSVIWSAHSDGIYAVRKLVTTLPAWADLAMNAESAAAELCRTFFDAPRWQHWIGAVDNDFCITVEIHAPAEIAGSYEVEIERVTRAKARKQPTTEGNRDATRS